jgi:hypothetical protein
MLVLPRPEKNPAEKFAPEKNKSRPRGEPVGRDWKNEAACKSCWQNSLQYESLIASVRPSPVLAILALQFPFPSLRVWLLLSGAKKMRQKTGF